MPRYDVDPREEINARLGAARAAMGGRLDPKSADFDAGANEAMNMLEMHARSHANQMVTREEYVAIIEQAASERLEVIAAQAGEIDAAAARLAEVEADRDVRLAAAEKQLASYAAHPAVKAAAAAAAAKEAEELAAAAAAKRAEAEALARDLAEMAEPAAEGK